MGLFNLAAANNAVELECTFAPDIPSANLEKARLGQKVQVELPEPHHHRVSPAGNVRKGTQSNDWRNDWLIVVLASYGLPMASLMLAAMLGAWALAPALASFLFAGSAPEISVGGGMPGSAAFNDTVTLICAMLGLFGGVIAWRLAAQPLLARSQASLCLRSARIVAVTPSSFGEPE